MSNLPKLAGITHLSKAQEQVVDHLWSMTGACAACDRAMEERTPKMAMAVVNTRWCSIEVVRNTIGISLYCGPCTEQINNLLRALKPKDHQANGNN